MLTITQKPVFPTNYHKGRSGGRSPSAIVIHISTGSAVGTDAWFHDAASHVSAHYLVCTDGTIHQFVQETDTAFHAGIIVSPTWLFAQQHPTLVNASTVGIEHEGIASHDLTTEQYAASAELVADICKRWSIPADSDHIIPHHAIRRDKACPGVLDVGRLILWVGQTLRMGDRPSLTGDSIDTDAGDTKPVT